MFCFRVEIGTTFILQKRLKPGNREIVEEAKDTRDKRPEDNPQSILWKQKVYKNVTFDFEPHFSAACSSLTPAERKQA